MTWSCRSPAMRSWSSTWASRIWSVRARASSMATAAWPAKVAAIPRSDSVNLGRTASRPSISAPRIRSPAVSGTTISGPMPTPSAAAAASRRSPVISPDLPTLIACPASEPASGAMRFASPTASGPVASATITWSGSRGRASRAKSASVAAAACPVIRACGRSWPSASSSGVSWVEASSQRRRCSDSANRRAFAIAAPAAAASAIASSSSSAVNSPPAVRSVRYRLPKTSSPMLTGTLTKLPIGGCPCGDPAAAG